jgi:hypothetical protein
MSAPKPRPAPVISQTLLMAMVPSCIGRLSVFSVYFNNGARNNLRSPFGPILKF